MALAIHQNIEHSVMETNVTHIKCIVDSDMYLVLLIITN